MKKLFLVLGVAAVCFCATSCKKDCKCSGTIKSTVLGVTSESTLPPTSVGEMSSSACNAYEYKSPGLSVPGAEVVYDVKCKVE